MNNQTTGGGVSNEEVHGEKMRIDGFGGVAPPPGLITLLIKRSIHKADNKMA